MKIILSLVSTLAFTSIAQADGFSCIDPTGTLAVQVFNKTHASEGVRNASVMVLSNPTIASGRRTIARFQADNALLSNTGSVYVAQVDLRYSDSNRGGEYVAGTRLGYVDSFSLDVAFNYSRPTVAGAKIPASLEVLKRDGSAIHLPMMCIRYLKN